MLSRKECTYLCGHMTNRVVVIKDTNKLLNDTHTIHLITTLNNKQLLIQFSNQKYKILE